MKRPKISRRAETRPYGRVSAPTGNCRKFLTQLNRIPTLRREPAQMTTQGGRQLMAAQCRKPCHRLLKVHHPTAGHPRATQGGRLQVLDAEIHHVGTRDHLTKRRLP